MVTSGKRALVAMLLLVGIPVVGGLLTFRTAERDRTSNYGTLLPPLPLPAEPLDDIEGGRFELASLRGRWVLMAVAGGGCNETCRQRLYYLRQIRTALGKDMGRVERVWMLSDAAAPDTRLLEEHRGMRVVRGANSNTLALLSQNGVATSSMMLIDPMGNLMMRFPDNPDGRRILKDLGHLLRLSRVG